MINKVNPNFPENLDIKPSESFLPTGNPDDQLFGATAQSDAIQKFGIAGKVWEAAYLLNTYIQCPRDLLFDPALLDEDDCTRPLNILELGSGTGIVSATLAEHLTERDATLVVTDLPEVCPLLEQNLQQRISRKSSPKVLVRPLSWGNSQEAMKIAVELGCLPSNSTATSGSQHLTHIICSDLVYFVELLAPLLRTLLQITTPPFAPTIPGRSPRVFISYKVRSLTKETLFWSAFGLWFSFQPVLVKRGQAAPEPNETSNVLPSSDNDAHANQTLEETWTRFGSADEDNLFIFVAERRPESLAWEVPYSDEDLLAGVGAWGSQTRKCDDTFEGLLFMGFGADI